MSVRTPEPVSPGPKLRVRDLRRDGGARFALVPDAAARDALAAALGIPALRSLGLEGRVEPSGREDWRLAGRLDATVVQECVVTLEPVVTRIEEEVERIYLAEMEEPEDAEVEMPDDAGEPLGHAIDLAALAAEALALALPPYPRAPGAALGEASVAPEGVEPMRDEDAKPFAGLAALRGRMDRGG